MSKKIGNFIKSKDFTDMKKILEKERMKNGKS